VNILQYCLLKHSGRTPAQLGIFDERPEPPLGAGVTVSVAADGRVAVRYRLGHANALYRLQMAKDGKPQRKLTKGNSRTFGRSGPGDTMDFGTPEQLAALAWDAVEEMFPLSPARPSDSMTLIEREVVSNYRRNFLAGRANIILKHFSRRET
jgi:hypothetical protein